MRGERFPSVDGALEPREPQKRFVDFSPSKTTTICRQTFGFPGAMALYRSVRSHFSFRGQALLSSLSFLPSFLPPFATPLYNNSNAVLRDRARIWRACFTCAHRLNTKNGALGADGFEYSVARRRAGSIWTVLASYFAGHVAPPFIKLNIHSHGTYGLLSPSSFFFSFFLQEFKSDRRLKEVKDHESMTFIRHSRDTDEERN